MQDSLLFPICLKMISMATSHNKQVSSFVPSALRPNPRFARTSDTHQTLYEMAGEGLKFEYENH